MACKAVKIINRSYRSRYAKKRVKGVGVYATQLPGAGPNGVHDAYNKSGCRCGGCSGALAAA